MKNIHEKFLSYLEGELSAEERRLIENEISSSIELKKDFEEFSHAYNTLSALGSEKLKAPEGFELDVMKAISLVNKRSSIMETIFRLFGKGLTSIGAIAAFFIGILCYASINYQQTVLGEDLLRHTVGSFFNILEGSTGAIILIGAISMTIIAPFLPRNFKRKVFIPLAPTFAGIAALTFVTRSLVGLHFGEDFKEAIPAVEKEQVTTNELTGPTGSFTEAAYDDELVRNSVGNLQKTIDKAIPGQIFGTESNKSDYDGESFGFAESNSQQENLAPEPQLGGIAVVDEMIAAPSLTESKERASSYSPKREIFGNQQYADYISIPQNTEEYNTSVENNYLEVKKSPLSTFSIDVDTASYSNIRRFLNQNQLPPKDSIRSEEMINYFKYDYVSPQTKDTPFAVSTELSRTPWNEKHQLLHIGLKGYEQDAANLPASNLVFLIDVSGSMDSPEKLPLLKQGLKLLVEQLRAQDRIAMVVYAGAAGLVLDSKTGNQKQEILSAIENMQAGGSTAGAAGLELAYNVAKSHFIKDGNNRIILATDGDFNVGVSSDAELIKIIEEKRKTGIFLSILGFGMGNYKDGKMEQLANKGNGNYAYIDNIHEAKKVLVNDFRGTIFAIAKDVKIQIEFNPAYVQAYRLIGYENRLLNKEDFNDDKKDAGELGAGHSVTALYEIVPTGVEFLPSVDDLKYQKVAPTPAAAIETTANGELVTVKLRYKLPSEDTSKLITQVVSSTPSESTSNNFKFAAAVAQFGMLLRDSEFKGNANFDSTLNLARVAKGEDTLGYRSEFIKLVETAKLLQK